MNNMKKLLMVLGVGALTLISCKSSSNKSDSKASQKEVQAVNASALKIAFYVEDSIATGFEYYKQEKGRLEGKQKTFEKKIEQMQKELESLGKTFEGKYRNNELAPVQIEQYQQRIQQMQMEIYNYQQTEGAKLEEEAFNGTKALMDKIDAYGMEFSQSNGYHILLSKKVGGQLIHADSTFDVTKEFIDFINNKEGEIAKDLE